ncbi:microtubule organization protein AKNA [Protopterus annectens]|uniref:microtubule organization protein AKNA n=1 Tax=Protopterus annectens TaxID=7888 RepID=UPI001CFA8FDB|nr:microtubule organization protein AKNA [Protopterus annectens]
MGDSKSRRASTDAGSRNGKVMEEERDFLSYMDENGIINISNGVHSGMDENGIIGMQESKEDFYLQFGPELEPENEMSRAGVSGEVSLLDQAEHAQDSSGEDSCDISDLETSEPTQHLDLAREDASISPSLYDTEHQEEDFMMPDDDDAHFNWLPKRDIQLDMTEDEGELDLAINCETKEQRSEQGYQGLHVEDELDTRRSYEMGLDTFRDSQALYDEYTKALNVTTDYGEDLSARSESPVPHKTSIITLNQTRWDSGSITAASGSNSRLGDTLPFPSDSNDLDTMKENKVLDSTLGSTKVNLSQTFLSHLSMEDLLNGPNIDAETFPESSCSESIEDPSGNLGRCVSRGRASIQGSSESNPSTERPIKNVFNVSNMENQKPLTLGQPSKPFHASKKTEEIKKNVIQSSPYKITRQSRSLSPKRATGDKKMVRTNSPKPDSNRSLLTEITKYGRGQLNYPLPDLSKVEPRVKFPKNDQGYKPPKGRSSPMRLSSSGPPLMFKSPAEIVRDVLRSSDEYCPPTPSPVKAMVPEEFRTPKQATELVHQLQEDYHKLLTKYAEAENTIDRLRLEAKVHLYSDPPNPSHSVPMGSVTQGSKVMTFTIPLPQKADFGPSPDAAKSSKQDTASVPTVESGQGFDSQEEKKLPSADTTDGNIESVPGEKLTLALAKQAGKFRVQVNFFEELMQLGRMTPQEQLKGFQQLKEALDTLERGYLQARDEHRKLQRQSGNFRLGDFDPDRKVEGDIFRLGMALEDLKDRIDQTTQIQPSPSAPPESVPPRSLALTPVSEPVTRPPSPSTSNLVPAVRTPYPESPMLDTVRGQAALDAEVSSASGESEAEDKLPETIHHKRLQVEDDYNGLLDRYNNFKTLPNVMVLEQLKEGASPRQETKSAWSDTAEKNQLTRSLRRPSLKEEPLRSVPLPEPMETKDVLLRDTRKTFVEPNDTSSQRQQIQPEIQKPRLQHVSVESKPFQPKLLGDASRNNSVSTVASEPSQNKPFRREKSVPLEERIVSPETDSGFIGSESSRFTPAAQTPEHQPTPSRCSSLGERLVKSSRLSEFQPSMRKNPQTVQSEEKLLSMPGSSEHIPLRESTLRHRDLQRELSQPSSPQQWSGSVSSEMEQNTYGTCTDSDREERGRSMSPFAHSSKLRNKRRASFSSFLSLQRSVNQQQPDPLLNRSARDEAIHALQSEVSLLRQELEKSLHKSQTNRGAFSPASSRLRAQTPERARSPGNVTFLRKSAEAAREEFEEPSRLTSSVGRSRSAPVLQGRTDLDVSSESDNSQSEPKLHSTRNMFGSSPRGSRLRGRQRRDGSMKFRGPYTGLFFFLTLLFIYLWMIYSSCHKNAMYGTADPKLSNVLGDSPAQEQNGPSVKHSTPKKGQSLCPLCYGSGKYLTHVVTGSPFGHGSGQKTSDTTTRSSGPNHKSRNHETVYVAVPPPPPHPAPAISCINPVQYVPYAPPVIYYSSPDITSVPSPAESRFYYSAGYKVVELQPQITSKLSRKHYHHRSLSLENIDRLNSSLSRAIEAAKSMKLTTKKMARSLTADLKTAEIIRDSCTS